MNRAAATALIAVACLAVPASASAAVSATATSATSAANKRADRAALNAYETYLQSLLADKPTAVAAEQLFASNTTSTCSKALEPIATSATVPAGANTALESIGDEIGADAGLQFLTSAVTPMTQLATTLSTLHWGTPGPALAIKRFLDANEALMALAPSNLCGDALSIASQSTSQEVNAAPATLTFLTTYEADTALGNARLTALVKMLNNWSTITDKPVAAKIDVLAIKVNTMSTAVITAGTKSLFRSLGIPVADSSSVRKGL